MLPQTVAKRLVWWGFPITLLIGEFHQSGTYDRLRNYMGRELPPRVGDLNATKTMLGQQLSIEHLFTSRVLSEDTIRYTR